MSALHDYEIDPALNGDQTASTSAGANGSRHVSGSKRKSRLSEEANPSPSLSGHRTRRRSLATSNVAAREVQDLTGGNAVSEKAFQLNTTIR